MADIIQWVATGATILAALVTASNLGARITGIGFIIFLVGSIAWLTTGLLTDQPALLWTNAVLSLLNIFGIWRWLGRQAKVERGAGTAAEASHDTPGEGLFPVSLLTSGEVRANGARAGSCVDAMAGASTGRLAYLVFTDGGLAGVGETLRRVDWSEVSVEGQRFRIDADLSQLPQIERDQWPGR